MIDLIIFISGLILGAALTLLVIYLKNRKSAGKPAVKNNIGRKNMSSKKTVLVGGKVAVKTLSTDAATKKKIKLTTKKTDDEIPIGTLPVSRSAIIVRKK